MKFVFYFALSLMLTSCGYHLVGQGKSTIIPESVLSANLSALGKQDLLLQQLKNNWLQDQNLPVLKSETASATHITLRIEQRNESFIPVAFDASGLAIQYRLQLQATLNMYQLQALTWRSGAVVVSADVFGSDNPSVVEAERERLSTLLRQKWAKEALSRLKSGF